MEICHMFGIRTILCLTCWLFITFSQCLPFDIDKSEFTRDVQVIHGHINYGGTYRLLQTTTRVASAVVFGALKISRPFMHGTATSHVFIEEWKRDDTWLIGVTYYGNSIFGRVQRTYVVKYMRTTYRISRSMKNNFLRGPVMIRMDMSSGCVHPVIDSKIVFNGGKPTIWYYVANKIPHHNNSSFSKLWSNDNDFLISPIVNIDAASRVTGYGPSSLIGHISGFSQFDDGHTIQITLGRTGDRIYTLHIPRNHERIFTPMCIVKDLTIIGTNQRIPAGSRPIKIVIDISKKEGPSGDVVILSNIRRGEWNYSQHAILPLRNMEEIDVSVKHVGRGCDIYDVKDDEIVTHVEIFKEEFDILVYVVVNTKMLENPSIERQYVFKYNNSLSSPAYSLLDDVQGKEALRKLCRIFTLLPDDLSDLHVPSE
ncbi:putative integral membrane protein [Babesia bovis T2Bo]|uniref:Uncharacterized protein n=1 Tax=Babesia bovis TaxID=5865 RepID=A7AQ54_BABBO|nr:putative integral membrane protein [Babesia bovis T2Bo]EDO08688.1 putative integral membrane protein [Babesia bovis T2Bo]|eukprot:XP_001612256.1 hypothetical protein [Babesia bovis T2Bo]